MRSKATVGAYALALAAALAAVAAGGAGAATRSCGTLYIGPGAKGHVSSTGPACMLQAFEGCHPATYTVSRFVVDALVSASFRIERKAGRCRVPVVASVRIVPQKAHLVRGVCTGLRRVKRDVLAVGCSKSLPTRISLNGGQ
jgi:hypothetical protein